VTTTCQPVPILSRVDDDELARRMAEGSPSACDEVLSRHGRFIYRLASELLRDPGRAEDATVAVVVGVAGRLRRQSGVPTRSLMGLLLDETFACCS
jgi:DNA-directed RNA polymerase specialized sigma24 family protein